MEIDWAVPASLFQFRLATVEQLRRLHAPQASAEKMWARLGRLRVGRSGTTLPEWGH
ncbi:hypothetical protein [Kitasatospora sp. NPDC058190]|uniref:hypothetical protein n=1 Tax=Kitasatospora sp. NPDC058190 TaxID=3346371 RepID=UPI0036DA9CCA